MCVCVSGNKRGKENLREKKREGVFHSSEASLWCVCVGVCVCVCVCVCVLKREMGPGGES